MAAHGFSAREAIGWLRVVRPGSVFGAQQHFLCRLGDALQLHAGDEAGVRDAVLSLDRPAEDTTPGPAASECGRSAQRRCKTVPRERSSPQCRIRPQSEI